VIHALDIGLAVAAGVCFCGAWTLSRRGDGGIARLEPRGLSDPPRLESADELVDEAREWADREEYELRWAAWKRESCREIQRRMFRESRRDVAVL